MKINVVSIEAGLMKKFFDKKKLDDKKNIG